jgi:hypothetical protein
MPNWITPPTFSYSYPASVDDMNILRNDLLYLFGQIFTHSSATIESETEWGTQINDWYTVAELWVEHKTDNLYYRINLLGERSQMDEDVECNIHLLEDPYVDPGDRVGTHGFSYMSLGNSYILFTNFDTPVDISGWSLTPGDLYKVIVECRSISNDNVEHWAEVQFMYEAP